MVKKMTYSEWKEGVEDEKDKEKEKGISVKKRSWIKDDRDSVTR